MIFRASLLLIVVLVCVCLSPPPPAARACCAVARSGKPVVNADQTVIIIWDAATKTQHFIRKASFKSEADDIGFLIPSPSQPQLNESGNEAFPVLLKLTEPEKKKMARPAGGVSCGCAAKSKTTKSDGGVKVLEEKEVAGFKAVVLEAKSADALVDWLKQHGYAYSPAVQAWAKPYVDKGWKFTALKIAKDKDGRAKKTVSAAALRMTFKTDRPLFPYREPESQQAAKSLGATSRLLRIYFLAEVRYKGELTQEQSWSGKVAWANKIGTGDRKKLLDLLKLPETTGPKEWWLTEFEDQWAYAAAPADVYFAPDADQRTLKREPIIEYTSSYWPTDVTVYAFAAVLLLIPLQSLRRRKAA